MKKIVTNNIIYLFLFVLSLSSCTEVIDIDLNESDPQIVIEGSVATNGEPSSIKITESISFDESNDFPLVENALVTISDDFGNSEDLIETFPGLYTSSTLIGESNRTYYLSVESGENSLISNSKLPNQVFIDELRVEETESEGGFGPGGQSSSHDIFISYTDPIEETNYYRFVEYINDEIKETYIFNDLLSNGLDVEQSLQRNGRNFETGDVIRIEMQCIDEFVYDYFQSFGNLFGGPSNSSTPANPNTNIEGSKLGYFSAHTFEVIEMVIE